MLRTIAIVDLASGVVFDRASNTPTLDVPSDFDRTTTVGQLDPATHLHYSTFGKPVVRPVFARPLSWRVRGEECLVEEERRKPASGPIRFLLSTVERMPVVVLKPPAAKPAKSPKSALAAVAGARSGARGAK
jgi:hypothetical protein